MSSPAETHLLSELDWVSTRADQMISRINQRLSERASMPPEFSMLTFLASKGAIRDRLEEAQAAGARLRELSTSEHEEQRSRDVLAVQKATLAIELQVTRLAGLLEALL